MGATLAASKADLQKGIVDAKTAAKDTGDVSTDQQDPDAILDTLATDLAAAIHAYTKSAKVVTKGDIDAAASSTDALTDTGGVTTTAGDADGVGQGGAAGPGGGLTALVEADLKAGILDAYKLMNTAGETEVQDPDMAQADKDTAIEALINTVLAQKLCDTIQAYITATTVETDVTVIGGVSVAGGVNTAATSAASGVAQPATGTTDEHGSGAGKATGTGKLS